MSSPLRFPGHRYSAGMSLVEVLVTLVSTSVGLLGIAALQLASLRSNQDTYMQLQAVALARSMLDRIRSNPVGFKNGDYDEVAFNSAESPGARARADLGAWQAEIDQELPGGALVSAGSLRRTDGSDRLAVTIRWRAGSAEQSANVRTFTVQSEI